MLQRSADLYYIEFDDMIVTVERLLQQLLTIKKDKLNVSIKVIKAEFCIEKEILIRVLLNLIDNAIQYSYSNSEVYLRIDKEDPKVNFRFFTTVLDLTLTRKRSYLKKP